MSTRRLIVVLLLLGVLLGACLGAIMASGNLPRVPWRFVLLFLIALAGWGGASWCTFRHASDRREVLWVVLCGAVLFRVFLLPAAPSLSTDFYRYLWDGKVQQAGINPYRFPPAAQELAHLRDDASFPAINHPDWVTIYPPGAQLFFRFMAWLAPGSILTMKGLFLLFDLTSCGLIVVLLKQYGMDPSRVILYAWHPLVLVEVAGSGHLDAVVVPLMLGALALAGRGRLTGAGLLLGLGGSVKLYPLLLLPAIAGRRPWRPLGGAMAMVTAGYLPFLFGEASPLGSVGRFVQDDWFNPGIRLWAEQAFEAVGMDPGSLVRWGMLAAVGFVGVWIWLGAGSHSLVERALWMLGAYLLLIPNLFPWYVVSIIPLLCLTASWPWLWLSGAVGLSYLFFAREPWSVPLWVMLMEFVPFCAGLLLAWLYRVAPQSLWLGWARRKEA